MRAKSLFLLWVIVILLIFGFFVGTNHVKSAVFAASPIDFTNIDETDVQSNSTATSKATPTKHDTLLNFDENCHMGDSYKGWFREKVPILKTVLLHHNHDNERSIRILLTTKHLSRKGPRKRREHYEIWAHKQQWHCHGGDYSNISTTSTTTSTSTNSSTLARLVGTGDHHGHTLLFECPSTIDELHSLSSHGPGGNITYGGNLTDFYHCQTRDHPLNAATALLRDKNISFVAHTMLAFAPARRMLPSWIEYHRIIMGIQHFIIYVNEPWESFTSNKDYFYHPPHVTYVPFRESLGLNPFKFQQAAQTDAIQRLKGTSVEWVAMMDVDEYFQLSPTVTEWSAAGTNIGASLVDNGSLLNLLRQQLELTATGNNSNDNDNDNFASFTVGSYNFGYHPYDNSSAFKDLPICAQVGRRPDIGGMKLFARPDYTNYVSMHMVSGGEKQVHLDSNATGLRYGHFHAERERFVNIPAVVLDTSFRHEACYTVRKELQAYFPRYKEDNMTAPPELYGYDTEQDAGSRTILPWKL